MIATTTAMRQALSKVSHPSLSHNSQAQRAVIVSVVQSIPDPRKLSTLEAQAFLHLRRSLIGNSPIRHDQLNLARDFLKDA